MTTQIPPDPWSPIAQLEAALRQWPTQIEQTVLQTIATAQLHLGGTALGCRDRLVAALVAAHASQSLERLEAEVAEVAQLLDPAQVEVVIGAMPWAADRALLASLFQELAHQDGALDLALEAVSRRAYGRSGLPLVLDPDETIQVEASAVLLSTLIAIELASGTASAFLQLIGAGELRKLLKADADLRQRILEQGGTILPVEGALGELLRDPEAPSGDWYLTLTRLGIQAAQVAEFVGQRMKEILRSSWLELVIFPPFTLVLDALRLLTSDLMLSVGNTAEATLDAASASRRVEIVLEALLQAKRVPQPGQILQGTDPVLTATGPILRPLMAKQLRAAADSFDPPIRNTWLNQVGQQLNWINPFQFVQAWTCREWVVSLLHKAETLLATYPGLEVLKHYAAGLARAEQAARAMEQAQILRALADELDQDPGSTAV